MLFWLLPRQRDVMQYRSPGCADVLRVARAHVTDFSYMTLMDKSAVKHNMLKMERYLRVNLLGPGPRPMKKEFTWLRFHKG